MIELPELPEPKVMHGLARLYGRAEFTATELRSYGVSCARAAMESAAQIAEITLEDVSDRSSIYGTESAAAIRAEIEKNLQ